MHDIDQASEAQQSESEFGELAQSDEALPLREADEFELASRLLGASSDQEVDQVLRDVFHAVGHAAGAFARPETGRRLGGLLKDAVMTALPIVGTTEGGTRDLAQEAGALLGLELEGLSPQDQEFESSRQLVRLMGRAYHNAAHAPRSMSPRVVARTAAVSSARRYAPGLLHGYAGRNPLGVVRDHRLGATGYDRRVVGPGARAYGGYRSPYAGSYGRYGSGRYGYRRYGYGGGDPAGWSGWSGDQSQDQDWWGPGYEPAPIPLHRHHRHHRWHPQVGAPDWVDAPPDSAPPPGPPDALAPPSGNGYGDPSVVADPTGQAAAAGAMATPPAPAADLTSQPPSVPAGGTPPAPPTPPPSTPDQAPEMEFGMSYYRQHGHHHQHHHRHRGYGNWPAPSMYGDDDDQSPDSQEMEYESSAPLQEVEEMEYASELMDVRRRAGARAVPRRPDQDGR